MSKTSQENNSTQEEVQTTASKQQRMTEVEETKLRLNRISLVHERRTYIKVAAELMDAAKRCAVQMEEIDERLAGQLGFFDSPTVQDSDE